MMNQQAMVSAHLPAWLIFIPVLVLAITLLNFHLNGDDKNSYSPGHVFTTTGGFPWSARNFIQHNKNARRKLTSEIPGFISVDCGLAEGSDYIDEGTGIPYTSDVRFIDTGVNGISSDYTSGYTTLERQLSSVRSFPLGNNNCYTFKPEQGKGNNHLIRATFMYGNYDSKDKPPEFGLYLEVDVWDTVKFESASDIVTKEIIHIPKTDYIHICLVNNNNGTPFISALEIRQLNNSIYQTQFGSLTLHRRVDIGSTDNQTVRYKDDAYDRIWEPYSFSGWDSISAAYTSDTLSNVDDAYRPPSMVMRTAATPANGSKSLDFVFYPDDISQQYYRYMHFAELEQLHPNQLRKFGISLNGDVLQDLIIPGYLVPTTVYSIHSLSEKRLEFSIYMTSDSTLPPILNALELYLVKEFLQSPTDQNDVTAVREVKSAYKVGRNWQGDPCVPTKYLWDGLRCGNTNSSLVIVSLNLSSSSLTGNIDHSLSNLISLESLDLSNNSLTGPVPDFLAQLPSLKTLKLSMNNLTGSVPSALIEKSNTGDLILSVEGNPNLCVAVSCQKAQNHKKENKTMRIIVPVVVCTILSLALLAAIAITWKCTRKRRQDVVVEYKKEGSFRSKERMFTHSELVSITNNFERAIGRGGSGTVYHGYLNDDTQVAVKVLSSSSTRSSHELHNEVKLLMRIHHRNLATLVGYCNEGPNMALIYEYMENGNLYQHLSAKDGKVLIWKERLQIAIDAAQGLEYLHNGCKPPIIHRDMKTTNILLNENFQAKISDFGLSRFFAAESEAYTLTAVAGTQGYLDPEYCMTNRLNEKSDVYSFGIVLLELITGKPAIIRDTETIHIVTWVQGLIQRGDIQSILDPKLQKGGDIINTNSAWIAIEAAIACVPPNAIQRPSMSRVLTELKECLAIATAAERSGGRTESSDNSFFSINANTTLSIETEMAPPAR